MATMVKEKRREKNKSKEKSKPKTVAEIPLGISETLIEGEDASSSKSTVVMKQEVTEETSEKTETFSDEQHITTATTITSDEILRAEAQELTEDNPVWEHQNFLVVKNETNQKESNPQTLETNSLTNKEATFISYVQLTKTDQTVATTSLENVTDNYKYLNVKLKNIAIPELTESVSGSRELELSSSNAYLKSSTETLPKTEFLDEEPLNILEPSAPMFEEEIQVQIPLKQKVVQESTPRLQCMPLEEAMKIYGGAEMAAVKVISEKEEAIVEAGPVSGPDHPLVDLLSTFRSSLRAVENERSKLACGFAEEEKSRSTLWKIEKRNIYQSQLCPCGTSVELRAVYEHAQLVKERMPVARLRLDSLLRDVQESYCHHQHAALLAHCQIDELISETSKGNKKEIREALSLVLQALRVSDGAAAVLAAALQRWAAALAAALLHHTDLRHQLFLLHHLFRQSRSVRWAARVLRPRVTDVTSAAQAVALLDTLLASPRLDAAAECTEEAEECEETWEEVSARGAGGGVREGALREIDLLALLRAFPLRDIVARTLLFTQADIRQARVGAWGDTSGGRHTLSACCGVRALLAALSRAAAAHAHYTRLNKELRDIAAAALDALACLRISARAPYHKDMEEKIAAELEACFIAGVDLFGSHDLHKLATTLLSEHAAKDYCLTYIVGLHDKSPKRIESLAIETPLLPCGERVRIVTQASVKRDTDHELARILLEFLFQTGGKVNSTSCKAGCVPAARACLPILLAAHPYLRTVALHTVASLTQVESLDPSIVSQLDVRQWRPQCDELQAVLHDWAQRCPLLLQQLLLQLDYTPYTGLSLPAQLVIGRWLCTRFRSQPTQAEWCWRILRRLRTHAACWGQYGDAPAPDPEPDDVFSNAYALLSSSWGHSIPLICSSGVSALCALATRPRELVHCLAPVMLVMAHSPESISLTPKFSEVFSLLVGTGPTLVQRALGRAGASGAELLLRLMLTQIEDQRGGHNRARVLPAWLHAMRGAPPLALSALDIAALAARDWPALDAHAVILQNENAKEHVTNAVRNASVAPLLCECLLRTYHTHREVNTRMFGAVSNILWEQRVNGQKIHVDNALQKLNANITSEELVIYRSASAALVAPLNHPAHLTLWRLFFHLYLQRPPNNMRDTAVPVGPLFFSGLIKSRTLSQIKKRLQETATHHHNEAETYKINNSREPNPPPRNRVVKSESITIEKGLLPALSIKDLTGVSGANDSDSDLSEEDSEGESNVEEGQVDVDTDKQYVVNMACYHTAAERMVREFCSWLEDGDRVRALPHHTDIARFVPEQALEEAWKHTLSRLRPPASSELDEFPRPVAPPNTSPETQKAPLDVAVESIMRIKDKSGIRSRSFIRSPLEDVNFNDTRMLLTVVDKHLKDIDTLAREWWNEVYRIAALDSTLLELIAVLRVPRPLPPVTRACTNKKPGMRCKPILFHISEREWCISTGAERGIKENRSSSRAAVRRLARPRPDVARSAAALHSIARRIRDSGAAVCVAERAWRNAGACANCGAAHAALTALVQLLAERWICHDGRLVSELLTRWCSQNSSSLQQTLCGMLISPRKMDMSEWPLVYTALLNAKLPSHTTFSYLSKFEMIHWSQSATPPHRRSLLTALTTAQVKYGRTPESDHHMLLELIGVHTTALINEQELCNVAMDFAKLSVDGKLPPEQWMHVVKAADVVSGSVGFDRLGHLLRELGALWWEARSRYNGATTLVPHAVHVAKLQCRLLRSFAAAAVALSYELERVGRYSWSALQESWGAWVTPHPATPPLLPSLVSEGGQYTAMLQGFVDCVQTVMGDCPGIEIVLLQLSFEWVCVSHMAVQGAGSSQESRVQASELMANVARLPWARHQWFYGNCLQLAIQICASNDVELTTWCSATWGHTDAATLTRDVTDDTLDTRLATLLYLLTGTALRHQQHILDEATLLPWWRLPEPALAEALDRFFAVHHNPVLAYHDLPQFRVLLHASELVVWPDVRQSAASRDKRAHAVSRWAHATAAPALHAHVASSTACLLQTITELAPQLDAASEELEDLLGRASVVMCMEPAATAALPVWQQWVVETSVPLRAACVSAAGALTALSHCAALADGAARAQLAAECEWSSLVSRWRQCSPWREAHVFCARACLHAAYVCALAHGQLTTARPLLAALQNANINFLENEAIVAVWICYACRVARACATNATSATSATSEAEECRHAARALLSAWAQPPRRSILSVVTLQPDTNRPTALLQLLCRLAECILSPSAATTLAYESACISAPGAHGAALPWGRAAEPRSLPRLAVRLYPLHETYFTHELRAVDS